MANNSVDLLWIQSLLIELRVQFHTPTILYYNLSVLVYIHNSIVHNRTKHIELDIHFVRKSVGQETECASFSNSSNLQIHLPSLCIPLTILL